MEGVQVAGRVNVSSEDEIKMTENTTTNEALEKIGSFVGFDSRDRRKSKYLSYPYTNTGPRHKALPAETEDLRIPSFSHKAETSSINTNLLNGSPSFPKVGSKRFRSNWYRKFISPSTIPSSPEFLTASSEQLLSGLHSKAVDCMFPMESESFDLVEWFFCRYRVSEYHDEAELATSLVNNVKGGNIGKPVANDLQNLKSDKKRRKNNKMENKVRQKMKSLSGLSDVNISSSTGGSLGPGNKLKQKRKAEEVTSLPTGDSLQPGSKLKPKRKVEEITLFPQLQNGEITLNQSSGRYSSILEAPQSLICFASERAGTERRNKVEAAPAYQSTQMASWNTDTKSTKCSSLVIDLQLISSSIPCGILQKCNGENKEAVVKDSNSELCVSQEGFVGNVINHGLSVSASSEVYTVSANETGLKGKMERVAERHLSTKLAPEIPDLNGTVSESNSISKEFENVNILSPEVKSDQSRSLSACVRPTETINYSRVVDNGEAVGTCLLLRFAPGVYLPSKEDFMATFFRFGPLNVSETQLFKETCSAQIAFVRSADAREAFRSLELNKPFGPALVDYKLRHLSEACPPAEQFVTPIQPTRQPVAGEAHPPLHFIRQNLQMMTSMLENSGNNLSPHMRAKLDSELKNLMNKVNSKGSSSLLKSEH